MNKTEEHYSNGTIQFRCSNCGKIYISPECAEACCTKHYGTCAEGFHSFEHELAVLQDRAAWKKLNSRAKSKRIINQ